MVEGARVAPTLDVRPNTHLPDGDTTGGALIAHKF